MIGWVEKAIEAVSPRWASERAAWREYHAWAASGYRGALTTRLSGGTPPTQGSPDFHAENDYSRERIADRAQQLCRDNCLARGIVERAADNIVARGIRPQARTADPEWNAKAESLFNAWAEGEADCRRMASFWEMQRLLAVSFLRDGDVGVVLLGDGSLQPIESARIAAPLGLERSPNHVDGIDLDPKTGRPLRYHVVQRRPDETYLAQFRDMPERTTVPADKMLFMARRQSPSQTRGESCLAQSVELFVHIDKLLEAVVTAARMAACFGVLIEQPMPLPGVMGTATSTSGDTAKSWKLEPAMVKHIRPGEKVSTLAPAQPTQSLDTFVRLLARVAGTPLGLPLELVLLDFSETNYSSARASLLQAQRSFRINQQTMIDRLLRPIWRWKIRQWIEDGELEPRADAVAHEWIAPGWPWVDPVKELQAAQMAVDTGLATVGELAAEQGKDFASLLAARSRELSDMQAAGMRETRSTMTREPMEPPVAQEVARG